ncbi:hypothetical protein BGZ76_006947 [Entomortierella beljakovae]|nr:hypothetical protein BGZ76_006947 [Entomortierella beljakovae]
MCYILDNVPGMKLRCLHYKYRLTNAPQDLLEKNISMIQEIAFTKPFIRHDEFMGIAQLLDQAKISTLKLNGCQYAGSSVLQQFARSCGASLRTLEIRQFVSIRPMGDHAFFPIDGPRDWDMASSITSLAQDLTLENQDNGAGSSSSSPTRSCPHIISPAMVVPSVSMDGVVEQLGISNESAVAVPPPSPQTNFIPPDVESEARMDLALKEFGTHCTKLSFLRLGSLTWISDDALSDFKPQLNHSSQQQQYFGLCGIEILESYYGSRLTLEGLLDICGPNLESLTRAMGYWWLTLKSLNIRLLKCSMEELKDALIDNQDDKETVAGLESLILGLPWLDDDSQETEDFGFELFKKYPRLETVRINRHVLNRKRG